jgi:hypothetical protein
VSFVLYINSCFVCQQKESDALDLPPAGAARFPGGADSAFPNAIADDRAREKT